MKRYPIRDPGLRLREELAKHYWSCTLDTSTCEVCQQAIVFAFEEIDIEFEKAHPEPPSSFHHPSRVSTLVGRVSTLTCVRPGSLDEFSSYAASGVRGTPPPPVGPDALIFTDDDAEGLLAFSVQHDQAEPVVMEMVRSMFVGHHGYAGMATPTSWSPDDVTPFFDCWVLVAVSAAGGPAMFVVLETNGPGAWRLDPIDTPWMYLSTAGAMRGWLQGEFTEIKRGTDPRLWNKVGEEPPPVDEKGHI